jgi:hypothetical protein
MATLLLFLIPCRQERDAPAEGCRRCAIHVGHLKEALQFLLFSITFRRCLVFSI